MHDALALVSRLVSLSPVLHTDLFAHRQKV